MATSKLQKQTSCLLSIHLGQYTIRENYRPEWLDGLETDFYIEEINVAIEVQGRQHYEWIKHFHKTYDEFLALQNRDKKKCDICEYLEVKLYYIHDGNELMNLIEQLAKIKFTYPLHLKAKESIVREEIEQLYRKMLRHKYIKSLCSRIKRYRQTHSESKNIETKANLKRAIEKRTNSIRNILVNRGYRQDHVEWFIGLI